MKGMEEGIAVLEGINAILKVLDIAYESKRIDMDEVTIINKNLIKTIDDFITKNTE